MSERRSANAWKWLKSNQELAIATGVVLLGLGIYLWQLSVPEFLSFYDTGVYLGAAIHFASGVLPYKDFTFVQPPGILILMGPAALMSRIFGSHDAFVFARVLSAFVAALNAGMLAWLVRHRGRLAMIVAGAGLVLIPVAIFVSSAVKLDSYSIFFVLIANLVMFAEPRNGTKHSKRRIVLVGVLFALAAFVKLWAVFPFIALVVCLVPRQRRRALLLVSSAATGFVAFCLPFFLMAPRNFISEVFVQQLLRKVTSEDSANIFTRLVTLSGLLPTTSIPSHGEIMLFGVVFVCVIAALFWRRLPDEIVDLYLLTASVLISFGLLMAPESYTYYGYYVAPFLIGLTAVSISRLGRQLRRFTTRVVVSEPMRRFLSWSTFVGVSGVTLAMTLNVTSLYSSYSWATGYDGAFLAPVTSEIPAGSCVIYQVAAVGIYANRFSSNDPNCPKVVDAYGMWMAWGYMKVAPKPTFVAQWESYFKAAQFVEVEYRRPAVPNGRGIYSVIPWSPGLITWFEAHYHLKFHEHYVNIFERNSNH